MTWIKCPALCSLICIAVCGYAQLPQSGTRLIEVTVSGRVERSGKYSLPEGATIQAAVDPLGRMYDGKSLELTAFLMHSNSSTKLIVYSKSWPTTILKDGDTVDVQRVVEVAVTGRVERPRRCPVPEGATIQDAIDRAGGIYRPEFLALVVELVHSNGPAISSVQEKKWPITVLKDGDTVHVPWIGF